MYRMSELPKVAVGALVVDNKLRVLLVKRKYPPAPNRWSIPGGHVEPGEELKEAVIRELKEETGIEGFNPKLIAVTEYISLGNGLRYHYIIVDFLIKEFRGELRPCDEVLDLGFFNLDEAFDLKLTVTTRMLLKHVRERGFEEVTHIIFKERRV